ITVQASRHTTPAHANLMVARAVNQMVFAIRSSITSIRCAGIAVLALTVFKASFLTSLVSARAAGGAVQRIAALWQTGSHKTGFVGFTQWSGRLAPGSGIALILCTRVIIVAERRVTIASVNGTVFQAAPSRIAVALIRPDTRAMFIALFERTTVKL